MSNCSYKHDISSEEFSDLDESMWSCPHDEYRDTGRCILHQRNPPANNDFTSEASEYILRSVSEYEDDKNMMIGSNLHGLEMKYEVIDSGSRYPIDLRHSVFNGEVNLKETELVNIVNFAGCDFKEEVNMIDTKFMSRTIFEKASFLKSSDFHLAEFCSWANFKESIFYRPANFRISRFENGIFGVGMQFESCADFMNCEFEQVANFYNATFNGGGIFSSATFKGDAKFVDCTFSGPTVVGNSNIGGPSLSESKNDYSKGIIENTSLLLSSITCKGRLQLNKSKSDSDILIRDSKISGDLQMKKLDNMSSDRISLSIKNTDNLSGEIENNGNFFFDLEASVLGDIEIYSDDRSDKSLKNFNFKKVVYDGFDFGKYKSLFRNQGWSLHNSSSLPPSEKENAYLRAKNGAIDVGETDAAREFHYREMLNRGKSYLKKAFSVDGESSYFFENKLKSLSFLWKWIVNQLFRLTCGYGERTSRVFFSSAFIILVFSLVFFVLGGESGYSGFLRTLSFSFQSFTALILGTPPSYSLLVSAIVSFEAFLGPFFIALFVFTITQSLGR